MFFFAAFQTEAGESLALVMVFVYHHLPKVGEDDVFSVIRSLVKFYNDKSGTGVKTVMLNFASNESYISEYTIMDMVSEQMFFYFIFKEGRVEHAGVSDFLSFIFQLLIRIGLIYEHCKHHISNFKTPNHLSSSLFPRTQIYDVCCTQPV